MSARTGFVVAALVSALGLPTMALAAAVGGSTSRDHQTEHKPTAFIVIWTKGTDGAVTFEGIAREDLKERVKKCKEEYTEAVKSYREAHRAALKAKEPFTEKPPQVPSVQRYGESIYKAQEQAKAAAEKLQQKYDEEKAKRDAKKADTGTGEHKKAEGGDAEK